MKKIKRKKKVCSCVCVNQKKKTKGKRSWWQNSLENKTLIMNG